MTYTTYHLEDYNKISFYGFTYTLPTVVLDIIQKLTTEIIVIDPTPQTQSQTTHTHSNENKYRKQSNNKRFKSSLHKETPDTTSADWNAGKTFKATKIEKTEGIQKSINDIRICLNKITNKNYEAQKTAIVQQMNFIFDQESSSSADEDDVPQQNSNIKIVTQAIFDIASNNKFYSDIYADLYKDLIQNFPSFETIIPLCIEQYNDSVKEIHYVDPNTDYDKFCEYNKKNDKRKALSHYIVNLTKRNVLDKPALIELIQRFQAIISEYIEIPNKNNEVEEITENLFILITNSTTLCMEMPNWENIMENVSQCSQLKAKDKASLSSRAIFKYKDMMDAYRKYTPK